MSTHTAPDQYLERASARLRWRLEGSGPAIVLLHGWALDLGYWDALAARLAPRFTVLRFDRCGFGLSAGTPDIHRNVEDLRALLDVAAVPRPVLLGMSQGARLAIHFALAYPARARALVLDGAPALEAEAELPVARYRHLLETRGLAALHADILAHPLMRLQAGGPSPELAAIVARYRGHDLLQPSRRGNSPDPGAITAPALILNGALDSPARLDAGRGLHAAIRASQRQEIGGGGHLALLDDPAAYTLAVVQFCNALPP